MQSKKCLSCGHQYGTDKFECPACHTSHFVRVASEVPEPQAKSAKGHEKVSDDPRIKHCLNQANVWIKANAIASAVNILLFVFWKTAFPEIAMLSAIILVPVHAIIGLLHILGLAGAAIVAYQCRRWREPALLIAVSLPSLLAMLYLFFWRT